MTAKECIMTRRSIREFTDQPVSHELLEEIVSVAAYAPSWKNTQITRYVAVEGEKKAKLAALTQSHNPAIIDSAAVVIAVCMITGRSGFERDGSYSTNRKDGWQIYDAGIASEAFCLAAHEAGLGSVILGLFDQPAVSELLEIPEGRELMALIAVGYPAQAPEAPKRKPVSELLSFQ